MIEIFIITILLIIVIPLLVCYWKAIIKLHTITGRIEAVNNKRHYNTNVTLKSIKEEIKEINKLKDLLKRKSYRDYIGKVNK
tara:strand:+ start:21216 stop:21461 length:246 start_codon:yes stop_codon:yes gene_type:complete